MDKTLTTHDEESGAHWRIGNDVEELLQQLKLDTYNNAYVVRITVDKVDVRPCEEEMTR